MDIYWIVTPGASGRLSAGRMVESDHSDRRV